MATKHDTKKQLYILAATILGSSIVGIDGNIVGLALPAIGGDLHANFANLQWIMDGYLLSLSALILLGGSLGDILGRKKVYLVGLAGFGISSLLCALSFDPTMLIFARVLQGIFGALLVPGALAIINTSFLPEARGKAIGHWAAWGSISFIVGPLLGGFILDIASWHWIFLINIPLIIACYYLTAKWVNEAKDPEPRTIDVRGAVLASLSLAGITFGLIEGPAQQWSLATITALIGGVVLGTLFILNESRTKDPMVHLSLFKSGNFAGANLMTFLLYGALAGFIFAFTIYLQTHLHYTAIQAGLSALPVTLGIAFFSSKVGALAAKYGARWFLVVGPLLVAIGMATLIFLKPGASYITAILPGILLFSAGMVCVVSPLTATVMASVSDKSSGVASGVNNAVSRVSGLVIIAALGLAGTANVYPFAVALSAGMALLAAIVSYFMIQNTPVSAPSVIIGK
ncbi:MAG TPA: MFS transporter [Candidatus Saccharimonadales bacterium]|nr:MFS transporter [Candidatus Saccharimonadales bacterium]